jgi:hypothetical protein
MLPRLTYLFLFASVVIPQTARAQPDSGNIDSQRIETEDLVLQVPATWTRLNVTNTIVTLLAPIPSAGHSFRDNIGVKKYPLAESDDLDKILSAEERIVGDKFEILGSGILSAGEPRIAWLAITQKQPESGQPLLAKIDYLMIDQGHLFVLHAMCETSAVDDRRPTFDAIARSVSFTRSSSPQQSTASKKNGSRNSEAFEQGRTLGRYTFCAMVAAVGAWLIFRVAKFVRKRLTKSEANPQR